jgi:hypothetical protein
MQGVHANHEAYNFSSPLTQRYARVAEQTKRSFDKLCQLLLGLSSAAAWLDGEAEGRTEMPMPPGPRITLTQAPSKTLRRMAGRPTRTAKDGDQIVGFAFCEIQI